MTIEKITGKLVAYNLALNASGAENYIPGILSLPIFCPRPDLS
jgi:hypothetical protein